MQRIKRGDVFPEGKTVLALAHFSRNVPIGGLGQTGKKEAHDQNTQGRRQNSGPRKKEGGSRVRPGGDSLLLVTGPILDPLKEPLK